MWAVLFLFPALASAFTASHNTVSIAVSSTEDRKLNLAYINAPAPNPNPSATWKLKVDDSKGGSRQTMDGFGAAWTDATVEVFNELEPQQQTTLLDELFAEGDRGIGMKFMRHTIGQSDLTPSWIGRWSFDQNDDRADPSLASFNLTVPGEKLLAWIQRMQALRSDVTLLGSPWSPPQWMKQDNNLQTQYVDAWVHYMVMYLKAYDNAGVRVSAMTLQNEPLHSADPAWTTFMDASYQALLVNKLGPAIAAAGLKTELWTYDHNTDRPDYPEYVLANTKQVQAVAWHCYANNVDWRVISDFHDSHPTMRQYMTECWTHLSDSGYFALADFMMGPVQNWASGALAWTLGGSTNFDVSYPGGCAPCSGIIQVDRAARTYEKTRDYYTLGQFSRFVEKNATFQSSTGSYTYPDGTGVQIAAFLNPSGTRTVVMVNKIYSELQLEVAFGRDVWNGPVPARSVTTWVLPSV